MKEVADDLQKDPEFGSKILEPIEIFGIEEIKPLHLELDKKVAEKSN